MENLRETLKQINFFERNKSRKIVEDLAQSSSVPLNFTNALGKVRSELPHDNGSMTNGEFERRSKPAYVKLLPCLRDEEPHIASMVIKYCLAVSQIKTEAVQKQQINDLLARIPDIPEKTKILEPVHRHFANIDDQTDLVVNTFSIEISSLSNPPHNKRLVKRMVDPDITVNQVINAIEKTEDYLSHGPNRLKLLQMCRK